MHSGSPTFGTFPLRKSDLIPVARVQGNPHIHRVLWANREDGSMRETEAKLRIQKAEKTSGKREQEDKAEARKPCLAIRQLSSHFSLSRGPKFGVKVDIF